MIFKIELRSAIRPRPLPRLPYSHSLLLFLILLLHLKPTTSFSLFLHRVSRTHSLLHSTQQHSSPDAAPSSPPPPSEMKLREIQSELKSLNVFFSDCFDRESLTRRLLDARAGTVQPKKEEKEKKDPPIPKKPTPQSSKAFNREQVLTELRALPVKTLRTKLSSKNIRWGAMLEKEEMVKALADALEQSANFSVSGALSPGEVGDVTSEELDMELKSSDAETPLLLDVYATWCGPCQLIAAEMEAAAMELGQQARVAKMDSDKYSDMAGGLRIGGLPTLILFDKGGKEVERQEGVLMRGQIVDLVRRHLS